MPQLVIYIFSFFQIFLFFLLFAGMLPAQDIPKEGEIIVSDCTDLFLLNSERLGCPSSNLDTLGLYLRQILTGKI